MKKNKSLCESCSNRVVIKFHGKNIRKGINEGECFYNFSVEVSDSRYEYSANGAICYETHVAYVIVDECSFYNKSINRFNKPIVKDSNSNSDSDSDSKESGVGGVTFTNIPGALLP